MKMDEIIQVGKSNVVVRNRKIYKTKGDTSLIYIPERAIEIFTKDRKKIEVRTTLIINTGQLRTLTYNYTAKLLPQYKKDGKYAYKYYFLQIPAKLAQTIKADLAFFGLGIEDLTAEVQLLHGENGLEALILLKPNK